MTVNIHGIAYSPVGYDIDEEWLQSSREVTIGDGILDIFREYLTTIINKRDTQKVGIGHFDDDENDGGIQHWLDEIKEMALDLEEGSDDYDRFEELSGKLANRLRGEMDARSSDGVLFTILAERSGEQFVGLLKLDLDDEQRSVLEEDTNELKYEELNRALPEAESLQKGGTYPVFQSEKFGLTGDVKFLQEDAPSEYFEDFLGCLTSSASLDQMKTIINGLSELKEEKTGAGLRPDEIREFESVITSVGDDIATNEEVHEGARRILGEDYEKQEVDDMLYEQNEANVRIDPDYSPKSVILSLDDDIEISAPISALSEDRLVIEEPNSEDGQWTVRIHASSLDRSVQK